MPLDSATYQETKPTREQRIASVSVPMPKTLRQAKNMMLDELIIALRERPNDFSTSFPHLIDNKTRMKFRIGTIETYGYHRGVTLREGYDGCLGNSHDDLTMWSAPIRWHRAVKAIKAWHRATTPPPVHFHEAIHLAKTNREAAIYREYEKPLVGMTD